MLMSIYPKALGKAKIFAITSGGKIVMIDLKGAALAAWMQFQKKNSSKFENSSIVVKKVSEEKKSSPQALPENLPPLDLANALQGLIRVDIINAQRGFTDSNDENSNKKNLTSQLRDYYETSHQDIIARVHRGSWSDINQRAGGRNICHGSNQPTGIVLQSDERNRHIGASVQRLTHTIWCRLVEV